MRIRRMQLCFLSEPPPTLTHRRSHTVFSLHSSVAMTNALRSTVKERQAWLACFLTCAASGASCSTFQLFTLMGGNTKVLSCSWSFKEKLWVTLMWDPTIGRYVCRSRASQQRLLLLLSCLQSHNQTEATPDPQLGSRYHKTLWCWNRWSKRSIVFWSGGCGTRCVPGALGCETGFTHQDSDTEGTHKPVPLLSLHTFGCFPILQLPLWLWYSKACQKEYCRGFTVSGEGDRCCAVRQHRHAVLSAEVASEESAAIQFSRICCVEIRGKHLRVQCSAVIYNS